MPRRRILIVLAALYLSCLWLDGVGTGIPNRILPGPLRLFIQVAQLFPRAAPERTEFRGARLAVRHAPLRGSSTFRPIFPFTPTTKRVASIARCSSI